MLAPGDRFCGECGATVGPAAGAVPLSKEDWKPGTTWKLLVGALAAVLVVALYLRFTTDRPEPAGTFGASATQGTAGRPAVDVLSMTPQQQADALFDRVMRLSAEGKRDSVQFFGPMAMGIYEQMQPLDLDQRFDLGTIALATGATPVARAQADTILRKDANHLLGLTLLSRAARAAGQAADASRADARLRQAADAELKLAAQKPEYQRHKGDIDTELKRLAGLD